MTLTQTRTLSHNQREKKKNCQKTEGTKLHFFSAFQFCLSRPLVIKTLGFFLLISSPFGDDSLKLHICKNALLQITLQFHVQTIHSKKYPEVHLTFWTLWFFRIFIDRSGIYGEKIHLTFILCSKKCMCLYGQKFYSPSPTSLQWYFLTGR